MAFLQVPAGFPVDLAVLVQPEIDLFINAVLLIGINEICILYQGYQFYFLESRAAAEQNLVGIQEIGWIGLR